MMRLTRTWAPCALILAVAMLNGGCILVPEIKDRIVELAVGGSTTVPFVSTGIGSTLNETSTVNVLFKKYFKDTKWIDAPDVDLHSGKLGAILEPLQRLSAQYGFDWRLIAAQAYQESHLDQEARSPSGAIGLMQLLPSTAKDMGFDDVTDAEDNLAAGIKYMAWLRDNYFSDPGVPEAVRVDFALAAYNAGPGRVRRWRREAPENGIDADRWFGGVENLALEQVGFEPVRYVANINKYFVVLTRLLDERARHDERMQEARRER